MLDAGFPHRSLIYSLGAHSCIAETVRPIVRSDRNSEKSQGRRQSERGQKECFHRSLPWPAASHPGGSSSVRRPAGREVSSSSKFDISSLTIRIASHDAPGSRGPQLLQLHPFVVSHDHLPPNANSAMSACWMLGICRISGPTSAFRPWGNHPLAAWYACRWSAREHQS